MRNEIPLWGHTVVWHSIGCCVQIVFQDVVESFAVDLHEFPGEKV